ncbi:MAG: GtrA family protein [Sphingobium sp.]
MIARTAHFVWRIRYARYLMASGLALATDLSIFMLLLEAGMAPVPASAMGYVAGLIVQWRISTHIVFSERLAPFISRRRRQKALFFLSAMVGLSITSAMVGIGGAFGIDPRLAKLAAILVSFQTIYWLRRTVVFA